MKELPNRQTIRLPGFNYSSPGFYFVTICSQNRECLFGKIENQKMILNDNGGIVKNNLDVLSQRFSILLDTFQIMPNHIHIIINIVGAGSSRPIQSGSSRPIQSGSSRPIQPEQSRIKLGNIIAYFKYQSTKKINDLIAKTACIAGAKTAPLHNEMKFVKIFQRNFYEHIICNEKEYYAIKNYIENNPQNWGKDKENPNIVKIRP